MIDTYFSTYENAYFTGDGAKRDAMDTFGLLVELMMY